uniref:Putative ubiquitin-like-specific protease 2B n=1 Tax=Anthurium amnicola TaxID=1678845 RepID=A0A1D1XKC7_9ARAE
MFLCGEHIIYFTCNFEDESSVLSNFSWCMFQLPQQQNSFDCGLFLLHYVELFLKEVPVDFSPFTITKFSNFLNMDWFIPDEASHKRFVIRDLMCDLLNDSEKDPPASYSNWDCSEPTEKTVAKELAEFPASTSNPVKADLDNSACSIAHDVIDNKLSTLSSPDCARYDKEAGYFLHHFFEANATRKATFDSAGHILQQSNSFRKITSTMSPIEEEEEADGQFSLSPQESSQPLTGSLKTRMTPTSYGSEDGVLDTCQKLDNLMQVEHHDEGDSSPDVTSCGSLNSLEHNTTNMDKKDKSLPHETIDDVLHDGVNKENQRSSPENCGQDPDCPSSVSGEVLDTCVVEDSQEADNTTSESADCGVSSTCCWETADSCQAMGPISNRDPLDEENRQPGGEKLNSILGTQRHKRQRITHE